MCFKQKTPKAQQPAAIAAPPPVASTAQVKSYVKSDAADNAQGFGPGVGDLQGGRTDGSGLTLPEPKKKRKGVIGLEI